MDSDHLYFACLFNNAYLWHNIFNLWEFIIDVQSILSLNVAYLCVRNLDVVNVFDLWLIMQIF